MKFSDPIYNGIFYHFDKFYLKFQKKLKEHGFYYSYIKIDEKKN